MSSARTMRADDKRRNYHKVGISADELSTGTAKSARARVSAIIHDRRNGSGKSGANGSGKRAY